MKINTRKLPYEEVLKLPRLEHRTPRMPSRLLAGVVRIASAPTLWKTKFHYTTERMELVGDEPCLILMNHCSFTDMKLAYGIFYPKPLGIITSVDAMTGPLGKLMRILGCTPTHKYVSDLTLIKDMEHMLKTNKTSVLMYPEAGYSFDGRTTTLPRKLGILMKKLGVPVVTVITQGAFHRDPLYNMLQELSVAELDARLDEAFSFDNFAWQRDNRISIDVPFRADGLHRILYKCPHCGAESRMEGKGIHLTCHACGKKWEMDEFGQLKALEGETEYPHIPDWYTWQRQCVRTEIENGTYRLDTDVEIGIQVNLDGICMIGSGHLTHDENGFRLTGAEGQLEYVQSPVASHTLYADYYWYEIGDVIGIGNNEFSYFCFPPANVSVTKARLATEELYKLLKARRRKKAE